MTYTEAIRSALPTRALLRRQQVQDLTGLPRATLYKLVSQGEFPAPIPLSGRSVAWDSQAIDAWILSRIAAASA